MENYVFLFRIDCRPGVENIMPFFTGPSEITASRMPVAVRTVQIFDWLAEEEIESTFVWDWALCESARLNGSLDCGLVFDDPARAVQCILLFGRINQEEP